MYRIFIFLPFVEDQTPYNPPLFAYFLSKSILILVLNDDNKIRGKSGSMK